MASAITTGPVHADRSGLLLCVGAPGPLHAAAGRWAVVAVHGDLDVATGPELDRVLRATVCEDEPDRHLVVDLRSVTFLDCSGLRPLLAARRRLKDRFWLANVPLQPHRLLELAGLTDAFAVLDDLPPLTFIPGGHQAGGPTAEAGTS